MCFISVRPAAVPINAECKKTTTHHRLNNESVLEAINLHNLLFLAWVTLSLPNTLQ